MNRNRSKQSTKKLPSIDSISSHIPLLSTTTKATADVHDVLQSIPMTSTRESKRTRTVCQPLGTISYTVTDNDTLEKVALRFNSTPSALRQLNKLTTRTIFPGQILFAPEEHSSDNSNQSQQSTNSAPSPLPLSPSTLTTSREGDAFTFLSDHRLLNGTSSASPRHQLQQDVGPMVWSMNRQTGARPGRAHRLKSDSSAESEPASRTHDERLAIQPDDHSKEVQKLQKSLSLEENQKLDEDCLQRFIKIHVRLMTDDQQSVAGTLLVTPNAVMFDPDVLDPLIKAHGVDKYGLIIRMDLLAGISVFEDLTMFEHEATVRDEEKRKMYHSTSVKNVQNNIPFHTDEQQIPDLMITQLDKIDKEVNPSDTCMLFDASSTLQRRLSKNLSDEDQKYLPLPQNETYLDDYKHSLGILMDDKEDQNENFNEIPADVSSTFDWTQLKHTAKVTEGCPWQSVVSLDQYNKRFDEIDKLLHQQQQIYLSPPPIDIPYYLCIRTSTHVRDIPSLYAKQYEQPGGIQAYNGYEEKPLENEYWFAVPKEKIEHLYFFFLRWTPQLELDPLLNDDEDPLPSTNLDQSKTNDKTPNRGFVLLVNDDPELNNNSNNDQPRKEHYLKHRNSMVKDWEIISVDEIYRRINSAHPSNQYLYDAGIPAPKFLHQSTLINEEQAKQILLELPARLHGLDWCMVFSTEMHGFSLNQLYRRAIETDHDLPSLLIVKDVEQNVFGAFVSHQLTISDGLYGTGESFLYAFNPKFRVFNWSGRNDFFVKGDLNSIGFGIGEGTYGLWIDGDLYHGRTSTSKTFNNERLTTNEDFIIASIEVWTFVD